MRGTTTTRSGPARNRARFCPHRSSGPKHSHGNWTDGGGPLNIYNNSGELLETRHYSYPKGT